MIKNTLNQNVGLALYGKRQEYIAMFMDENPESFPAPVSGEGWLARYKSPEPLSEQELRLIDRGTGMLVGVFRTAQSSMPQTQALTDMLSPEKVPDVKELALDPIAFAVMGGDMEDDEAIAFARSVTLLKQMTGIGVVNPEQILSLIEQTMDSLPANSKLQRSALEYAKRLAISNVELMMES